MSTHTEASRFDHIHGDEGLLDPAPFMEGALEEVVECVLEFGSWPKPRNVGSVYSHFNAKFDLWDWIGEHRTHDDLVDLAYQVATTRQVHVTRCVYKFTGRIDEDITAELKDSAIVLERALELAREWADTK